MGRVLLLVCVCVGVASGQSGMDGMIVGQHLVHGSDVATANVYDGSRSFATQPGFRGEDCMCSADQCARNACPRTCHMETRQVESRFYYGQFTDSVGEMWLRPATIVATPLCHTDPKVMSLDLSAKVQPSSMVLGPEELAIVELEFICRSSASHSSSTTGLFDVQVNFPVRKRSGEEKNVTWHFRKACITEWAFADNLRVMYEGNAVVSGGEVQGVWSPTSSNSFDIGYDSSVKTVDFSVSYRSSTSSGGRLKFSMIEPEFDQTVIKSVSYLGTGFDLGRSNMLYSGGTTHPLQLKIVCQELVQREASPGDVIVGFNNITDSDGNMLKPVEFKFQVECPYRGNKITPFGVLLIVFIAYGVVAMGGGYWYNITYTTRRGLDALPLMDTLRALMSRKSGKYYPVVQDDDYDDMQEEIIAGVRGDESAYGAI